MKLKKFRAFKPNSCNKEFLGFYAIRSRDEFWAIEPIVMNFGSNFFRKEEVFFGQAPNLVDFRILFGLLVDLAHDCMMYCLLMWCALSNKVMPHGTEQVLISSIFYTFSQTVVFVKASLAYLSKKKRVKASLADELIFLIQYMRNLVRTFVPSCLVFVCISFSRYHKLTK